METLKYQGYEITLTGEAFADNYGTDGGVRYYSWGKLENKSGNQVDVRVAWDTTAEWDENAERYARLLELVQDWRQGGITEEEEDELDELQNELAGVDMGDESNACDWDNPAEVTLRDGGDFFLVESID